MIRFILLTFVSVALFNCTDKPDPVVEETPPPKPEPTPAAKKAEVPATPEEVIRVQDLLNKILENKVFFEFDKAEITEEGQKILAEVGDIMKQTEVGRKISVVISGHTDEVGTAEYNLALGERRARAVMEYLEVYGVEKGRISIKSFGEEAPAVQGSGENVNAQNRRAEFIAKATIQ